MPEFKSFLLFVSSSSFGSLKKLITINVKKLMSIYDGYNGLVLKVEVYTTDLRCTH